ncbi:unnamed protein product [Nippostrongylus brasiliensis]|uniref:Protein kinase domain-containing protein n=1 Tax=Nippostrongylus brasiliensis TaxID=27835 RepID=A0A0N4Y4I6_NIPBR|nr:unnamed protein product [Nippostrongylus brasiliensis]
MMVARVKADSREVRSEPPTYVSIHVSAKDLQIKTCQLITEKELVLIVNLAIQEESEQSETEEQEEEPRGRVGKFVASRRSHDEAPTHKPHYPRDDTFCRTVSAQSLPVSDRLEELSQMTIYDRTLHMLAVDPIYQKEVALGKRIGFYRLGKELGAGNFSKVKLGIHVLTKGMFVMPYLIRNRNGASCTSGECIPFLFCNFLSEKVAVKIMDRTKMDTKAQRLLEREIKAMEQMHHPNIIRLFECVETLTRTHLVLEYAGGGELYAFVHERGKLSENDAKPLFAQIAENIMFSSPGIVKLVDFGFSCMIPSPAEQLTTFCGSPPYAAPELFRQVIFLLFALIFAYDTLQVYISECHEQKPARLYFV